MSKEPEADGRFSRVALMGIGLIGSSLARAMRKHNLADHIAIYTRREETLNTARELGLGDSYSTDPADVVTDADLVIFCVPVGANAALATQCGSAFKAGAIISDVGSVKKAVIRDIGPVLPDRVHLVPAHPIAGTEYSGPEAGFATLFQGRWCIVTPPPGTQEQATRSVVRFWERMGSMVAEMEAGHHDAVLAITSHLPHLIAYTIVGTATDLETSIQQEVIKYSAGGFRDFTRIAASDPVMWRDVFLNNKEAVLEMLGRFSEDLSAVQRMIRWGEGDKLEELFHRTGEIRRGVIEAKQA